MNAWLSNVLAHSRDSLGVSLSYSTMTITTDSQSKVKTEVDLSAVKSKQVTNDEAITMLTEKMEQLEIALNKAKGKQPIVVESTDVNIPANPRIRDGKVYDRLLHSVSIMKKKGVVVNKKNLKDLKYGTKAIKQYFDAQKAK